MATISVRPPGEQMGYEPANEMRRKSGVFVPVRVSHAYAHTHASGCRECVCVRVCLSAHSYSSAELMGAH